jgi:hypothetical protein
MKHFPKNLYLKKAYYYHVLQVRSDFGSVINKIVVEYLSAAVGCCDFGERAW